MTPRQRKLFISLTGFLVLLLLSVVVLTIGVLYRQWDSQPVRTLARFFHIPAGKVGSKVISYDEYLNQTDARRRVLAGPAARAQGLPETLTPEMKQISLDILLRIKAIEEKADGYKIVVTPIDVSRAYDGLIEQAGTSTTPEMIRTFLNDQFGWSEEQFKQNVVRPALLEDEVKLQMLKESQDADFEKWLAERLQNGDVKRYVKI